MRVGGASAPRRGVAACSARRALERQDEHACSTRRSCVAGVAGDEQARRSCVAHGAVACSTSVERTAPRPCACPAGVSPARALVWWASRACPSAGRCWASARHQPAPARPAESVGRVPPWSRSMTPPRRRIPRHRAPSREHAAQSGSLSSRRTWSDGGASRPSQRPTWHRPVGRRATAVTARPDGPGGPQR